MVSPLTKILGAGGIVASFVALWLYSQVNRLEGERALLIEQKGRLSTIIAEQDRVNKSILDNADKVTDLVLVRDRALEAISAESNERIIEIERLKTDARFKDLKDPFGSSVELNTLLTDRLRRLSGDPQGSEGANTDKTSDKPGT